MENKTMYCNLYHNSVNGKFKTGKNKYPSKTMAIKNKQEPKFGYIYFATIECSIKEEDHK